MNQAMLVMLYKTQDLSGVGCAGPVYGIASHSAVNKTWILTIVWPFIYAEVLSSHRNSQVCLWKIGFSESLGPWLFV